MTVEADRPDLRTHQRRQGFVEVARADAFEVQPGNQLLQALGLSQVRRKNLRGKRFCFLLAASIEHPRLLDLDRTDAGGDRPLRQMAVANHLAMAGCVGQVRMAVDPLGDFGFDRLGQQPLRTVTKNVGQHVLRRGRWQGNVELLLSGMVAYSWGIGSLKQPNSNPSTPPFSTPLIHNI